MIPPRTVTKQRLRLLRGGVIRKNFALGVNPGPLITRGIFYEI